MHGLESDKCDRQMGAEFVISLLAARNVIRECPRMARSDSRVQRVLPGARDSGKLARIGRLSDMALEAQWVSSLGRILSIGTKFGR